MSMRLRFVAAAGMESFFFGGVEDEDEDEALSLGIQEEEDARAGPLE
jgi:hypothetical protein